MKYSLEIKPTALKSLSKIQKQDAIKIDEAIVKLKTNPFPSGYKKLKTNENKYRIRVGNYRVIYTIENQLLIILILKIGSRGDVYKD